MSDTAGAAFAEAVTLALNHVDAGECARVSFDASALDFFDLLDSGGSLEKFYWSDRKRTFEWIGLGIAEECRLSEATSGARFGLVNFNGDRTRFILPQIEITRSTKCAYLNVRVLNSASRAALEGFRKGVKKGVTSLTKAIGDNWVGNFQAFEQSFIECKKLLDSHSLNKVVLANARDFQFPEKVNPVSLLRYLDEHSPQTYRFLFQTNDEEAFVGASPELLFSRSGRRIESEAQAGTRQRGKNAAEDSAFAFELLESQKEFIEHDLVIQDIESRLSSICVDSGWIDQRQIVKLSHVQHLRSRFGGILKPEVTDADIVRLLHPTPAVCGSPKAEAKACIDRLETFDRGFYCGAVGMISSERTELAVGLRCALVKANNVRIFAGAGLVSGSRAENEWDEIDSKMRLYYNALGYAHR